VAWPSPLATRVGVTEGEGVPRKGEGREKRGRDCVGEREKHRISMHNNGGGLTREEDIRRRWGEIRQLMANRRSIQRIESARAKISTRRKQRYPWIPPTTHGAKVIARRNCRSSWNRPDLR
jgi:hypothetical protein